MKFIRGLFVLVIITIALGATLYVNRVAVLDWVSDVSKPDLPAAVSYEEIVDEKEFDGFVDIEPEYMEEEVVGEVVVVEEEESVEEIVEEEVEEMVVEVSLPPEINLAVPFTSQAPHAVWEQPYQDLCEEASVYMVAEYYAGTSAQPIDPDVADKDLIEIKDFEIGLFGYYESTSAEQVGVFAEMMYGFSSVELIEDPTVEQIKEHLVDGRPVIVPSAGRLLGNPNFTPPGPEYHMLVVRGYTSDDQFITNDPGTRNGEQYLYDFDTILYAMHDYSEGEEITEGRKVIIVIYP